MPHDVGHCGDWLLRAGQPRRLVAEVAERARERQVAVHPPLDDSAAAADNPRCDKKTRKTRRGIPRMNPPNCLSHQGGELWHPSWKFIYIYIYIVASELGVVAPLPPYHQACDLSPFVFVCLICVLPITRFVISGFSFFLGAGERQTCFLPIIRLVIS